MMRVRRGRRPIHGPRAEAPLRGTLRLWPWVAGGIVLGALLVVLAQAPARWLAQALADASGQRLLLADARGSVWSGSAVLVLTGGAGSRSASALPGRLHWRLALAGLTQLELRLSQACCLVDTVPLRISPGLTRWRVALPDGPRAIGRWPAGWLVGLGAPFNTLQLGGSLALSSNGLALDVAQGRWQLSGGAELELGDLSSALAAVDPLGSYSLRMIGSGSGSGIAGEGAQLVLATRQGPLQMAGSGTWVGPRLRFRGEARADPGSEAMLNNLLNLLGPRQGALALLSIG